MLDLVADEARAVFGVTDGHGDAAEAVVDRGDAPVFKIHRLFDERCRGNHDGGGLVPIHAAEQLGLEGGAGGGVEKQRFAEEFAEKTGIRFHNYSAAGCWT